jgi:chorismate mutase
LTSKFFKLSVKESITVRNYLTGQYRRILKRLLTSGKFVSESKFVEKPSDFVPHILSRNREALEGLITKPAVEKALLARLTKKAAFYGQDLGPDGQPLPNGGSTRIDVQGVKDLYEKYIIPLTKDVEVSAPDAPKSVAEAFRLGGLPSATLRWFDRGRN